MRKYRSLEMLKRISQTKKADKIVLVTSTVLSKKLKWAIDKVAQLRLPGFEVILIPDGEKAKSWDNLKRLLVSFVKLKLTKKSLVIALGGGSVSDLVGFACSVYKRGAVQYVNVPTTLLAEVDASVGGKTAIDFEGYKNLIGSFYDPVAIFIIPRFLESLSRNQFIDGIAEIIKAGLIKDPKILDILSCSSMSVLRQKPGKLSELILRAIAVKEYFVKKDPNDNGARQMLNVGHTIGHAIEIKYKLNHGMSVLLGMMFEFNVASILGINTAESKRCLAEILAHLGINIKLDKFVIDRQSVLQDKKIVGKEIVLPVVMEPGKTKLVKIKLNKFLEAIKKCG